MNPYVYCNIIYNRQDMEATIDRWIDRWIKKIYIYIHTLPPIVTEEKQSHRYRE